MGTSYYKVGVGFQKGVGAGVCPLPREARKLLISIQYVALLEHTCLLHYQKTIACGKICTFCIIDIMLHLSHQITKLGQREQN